MKYVDPDTYRKSREDAIRTMIYGQGINLSEFNRVYSIPHSTITRILHPYHSSKLETVDRVYRLLYSIAPEPIEVIGPHYDDWEDELLTVIKDYQDEMGYTTEEMCFLTGMTNSLYVNYIRKERRPKSSTLWKAFSAVRRRITTMR